MDIMIRPMTKQEKMYCYTQSQQIRNQTGNIGYLRADMDTSGEGFFSTWNDFWPDLKTPDFIKEFESVINELRYSDRPDSFLKNRSALMKYCFSHFDSSINDHEFGFRVDTDDYVYMMRLNPNRGEYNLYCYCYRRDWLERNLEKAEKGIRFIDSCYHDLFRLPDGGKIRISYPDGEIREATCRYIDSYHAEVGFGSINLFHICEFAERMEKCGATIEPVDPVLQPERHKEYVR